MKIGKFFSCLLIYLISLGFLTSCGGFKKVGSETDARWGKGQSSKKYRRRQRCKLGGMLGGGNTNYEFSTSNPMWRASLETLDFYHLQQ